MSISSLREQIGSRLVGFAWNEWAQMGVFAEPRRESPWAADPEAHLIFGLQVARQEPRLFDELLDWMATNANFLSAQRFRNMYASREDEQLGEAAIAWAGDHAEGTRVPSARPVRSDSEPEPLFYESRIPTRRDEAFLKMGLLKPRTERTRKSTTPQLRRPINFAFLLRQAFGVGSRAEILRFLLTATRRSPVGSRPLFTTAAIAEAAGFAKRNVQESLNALASAGAIELIVRGNENVYAIRPEDWRAPLAIDEFPAYRDWTHALLAFRELHRWLWSADLDALTPYMRASEARLKMGEIESAFRYAGIPLLQHDAAGEAYWDVFVEAVNAAVAELEGGLAW